MTEKEIETAYKEMADAFDKEVRGTACSSCGNYTFAKKDYSFDAFVKELGSNLEKYNWDIHETIYQTSPDSIEYSLKWVNGMYADAHFIYHGFPFMHEFKVNVTKFIDELMRLEAIRIAHEKGKLKEEDE
jgi:hypothetical protein